MERNTRMCKICGKEYVYCMSLKYPDGVYHWQEVACGPEHGGVYLERLFATNANTGLSAPVAKAEDKAAVKTAAVKAEKKPEELTDEYFDDEDFDEEDDEDFDDEDDE